MKFYMVDEDGVSHWVSAAGEEDACAMVRERHREEGLDDETGELKAFPVRGDKSLTFHFDGLAITHTATEWGAIFGGSPRHYIACSEW